MSLGYIGKTSSPLESAVSVIELRGFEVLSDSDDDDAVSFYFPNRFGKPIEASVEYSRVLNLVEITAEIACLEIPNFMVSELQRLLLALSGELKGLKFGMSTDDENFSSLTVSATHLIVEGIDIEPGIERTLTYLDHGLRATLPAFYAFLIQKPVYRIDTDGNLLSVRLTSSALDSIEMLRSGLYGTA